MSPALRAPAAALAAALVSLTALAACTQDAGPQAGARAYAQGCAACHGPAATGASAPDLTGLARREGGFPRRAVLERLDAYGGAVAGMPDLSHLMTGRMIAVDLGDGTRRLMPETIPALAAWLASIQR